MSVAERRLWTKALPHLVVPEVLACFSFLAAHHATGIYRPFFWIVSGLAGMVFACPAQPGSGARGRSAIADPCCADMETRTEGIESRRPGCNSGCVLRAG